MLLTALSVRLAELTVPAGPHEFGVRSRDWPPLHEVGGYGSPRWLLRPGLAPDDGWEIDTVPTGRGLIARRAVPVQFEWSYLCWAEGSRAESGAGLLLALPPGRYLLVRSSLVPRPGGEVLLGNEWAPAPANMVGLLEATRSHYAMAVGADADRPPELDRPLVGVVLLNYTGVTDLAGTLFFASPAAPGQPARTPPTGSEASGDLVLVVPVTGGLVLDALGRFAPARTALDRATWQEIGARRLAALLVGEYGR